MTAAEPRVFVIDGRKVATPADFYRELGVAVNGPGGYFGRNLDALADCLRGGFGTPADRPFAFAWQHSGTSRKHLRANAGIAAGFAAQVCRVFADAGVRLDLL